MPTFPELVKDIVPGLLGSAPENLTIFNDKLFFSARSSGAGQELWVSDGTTAGTQLVKDISPGTGDSSPKDLTVFNGKLFFTADDGSANGRELWVSDGTATGTQLLKDIYPGRRGVLDSDYAPTGMTVFNGRLFFSANDGINGRELWSTDGTTAGTQLFKDINPGSNSSSSPFSSDPTNFTVFNGKLIFAALEASTARELWISDGTAAGTQLLKDIASGPQSFFWGSSPSNFTILGNKLYFTATEWGVAGEHGEELWVTDGTTTGTQLVKDIHLGRANDSSPTELTVLNGKLVFSATDGSINGRELWITDGTEAGTQLVKDISPGILSSAPTNLTVYNGKVFFSANDGTNGREVWVSDGTTAGTQLLKVISPGTSSTDYNPIDFGVFDGKLFISIDNGTNGTELWSSDGTAVGTQLFADIFPGSVGSAPGQFTVLGNMLFFTAFGRVNGSSVGQELWKLDSETPVLSSLTIAPTNVNQLEGNTGTTPFTFTVTRTGNLSTASSVQYAITGSGVSPANPIDFGGTLPTGTVDFAANQTTATLTININGDLTIEPDEEFTVILSNPSNATIVTNSAIGSIRNDDQTVTPPPGTPPSTPPGTPPGTPPVTSTIVPIFTVFQLNQTLTLNKFIWKLLIAQPPGLQELFDEEFYLRQNPDVAAAVAKRGFQSGLQHFIQFGQYEGRNPSGLYDERYYLSQNPDVAAAVARGNFRSGFQHFLRYGQYEGRNPCSFYNEQTYLAQNQDVAAAVSRGSFRSGIQHFLRFGFTEGRLFNLTLFNEQYYLSQNPDVAAAVARGGFKNGLQHFEQYGQREGRQPSPLFNERYYLSQNPDVAAAVARGQFKSGFDHYLDFGRFEGRKGIG